MKLSLYLFLISILGVFSVLPVWNLKNTAIDLLPNKNTDESHEYTIETRKMVLLGKMRQRLFKKK